jgi:hypothetical protein
MEEKYKKSVQRETELESLYHMEVAKVEELKEQLRQVKAVEESEKKVREKRPTRKVK